MSFFQGVAVAAILTGLFGLAGCSFGVRNDKYEQVQAERDASELEAGSCAAELRGAYRALFECEGEKQR